MGFAATLQPAWDSQPLDGTNSNLYWGEVTLVSLGAESDAFVRSLAEVYGISTCPAHMGATANFKAVGLASDPRRVADEPVKMKLFFVPRDERDRDERYAEVYLNVDAARSMVELHEKDPDYRRPLIAALADSSYRAPRKPWWKFW